jgi:hypothetical protein
MLELRTEQAIGQSTLSRCMHTVLNARNHGSNRAVNQHTCMPPHAYRVLALPRGPQNFYMNHGSESRLFDIPRYVHLCVHNNLCVSFQVFKHMTLFLRILWCLAAPTKQIPRHRHAVSVCAIRGGVQVSCGLGHESSNAVRFVVIPGQYLLHPGRAGTHTHTHTHTHTQRGFNMIRMEWAAVTVIGAVISIFCWDRKFIQ